jgi:hypothetical protein
MMTECNSIQSDLSNLEANFISSFENNPIHNSETENVAVNYDETNKNKNKNLNPNPNPNPNLNICIHTFCNQTCLHIFAQITFMTIFMFWYVFNILAVISISDANVHRHCSSSSLWEYMLTNVAVVGVLCLRRMKKSLEPETNLRYCCKTELFIMFGITTWGALDLFIVPCADNLQYTFLYQMTCINVTGIAAIYFFLTLWFMYQSTLPPQTHSNNELDT